MAENKTQPTDADVTAFIDSIEDEGKRRDSQTILQLMRDATGQEPTMWGSSIVGFGKYHYTYASGRSGDYFLTGFSPRKSNLTLYLSEGFDRYTELLSRLGKHSTGKSCLYIKRLDDVDLDVLKTLVSESVKHTAGA